MGDNRSEASEGHGAGRRIAGYEAVRVAIRAGDAAVALWTVADLERYVDREALLRADDPPEPPYWAYCWSGARVLAARVPRDGGRVVEVGCGLGLPGLAAAVRGARVVFADRVAAPLAFVRASLEANALVGHHVAVADLLAAPWKAGFDVVLAAEILYDRSAFPRIAPALAAMVTEDGTILLADGHRIDTKEFYVHAEAAGLQWTSEDVSVTEEGFQTTITLATMRRTN